jgi:hypothetical protein
MSSTTGRRFSAPINAEMADAIAEEKTDARGRSLSIGGYHCRSWGGGQRGAVRSGKHENSHEHKTAMSMKQR